MSATRKLKAAIVGYGISGKLSHAYGLSANEEFEIVAVCDLSPERREEAERELNCASYPDHQSLLQANPDLDLACVITRSDTHCEIAIDFLEKSISVLITKPWVLDANEAESLIAAQKQSSAQLFPWVPVYWSQEFLKVQELLEEGSIGNVFMIRRQLSDFRRREDWQTQQRFGGGYLLNWGAHIVQPLVALARTPLKSVTGRLQKILNPGDADDAFFALLEFEDGCLGIAEFTQACDGLPSLMVQGDRGMIRSDGKEITLLQKDPSDPSPPREQVFPITGKLYGDEADIYRDVARSLLHGAPYAVSVEDALHNTRILDAIRASDETRKSIPLPARSLC